LQARRRARIIGDASRAGIDRRGEPVRALRVSTLPISLLAALVLASGAAALETRPNLLLIVVDDVGVETLNAYNQDLASREVEAASPPPEHRVTPRIDELAQRGVVFRNAWSTPSCRATRQTILTGLHQFRTGSRFSPARSTLPNRLPAAYVDREAIGKWHLSDFITTRPPSYAALDRRPTAYGFTRYRGFWEPAVGGLYSYRSFPWAEDPPPDPPVIATRADAYLTTREIETAIEFVRRPRPPGESWFLWLALHALHDSWSECDTPRPPGLSCEPRYPDHQCAAPPPGARCPSPPPRSACDEIGRGTNGAFWSGATARRARCRMLEMMDYEIGRLLDAVDLASTTVFFVGDNGTPATGLAQIPGKVNAGAKGGVSEGGINVPLIVAGAGVTADAGASSGYEETSALVHTVDLMPTLLELAGAAPGGFVDGVSFAPVLRAPEQTVRSCVYADGLVDGAPAPAHHDVTIRDGTHKLIRRKRDARGVHAYELYDLTRDRGERVNLAARGGAAFEALKSRLDALDADPGASPCQPDCLSALNSCAVPRTSYANGGDELEAVLGASRRVDAECTVFTNRDGSASASWSVAYEPGRASGATCWFGGDARGSFPLTGAGSGAVYACQPAAGHCGSDGNCCDDDPRCPGCAAAIAGYDGYHGTQAMKFVSGPAGTARGAQNNLDQVRFADSGHGLSIEDGTVSSADPDGDRSLHPVLRIRHSCFEALRDAALEEGYRKHDLDVQFSLFNRVETAFSYRARPAFRFVGEVPGWRFTINGNRIKLFRFASTERQQPKFGGLFEEDPSLRFDPARHPSIVFTNNTVAFSRHEQYDLARGASGTPSIFPHPDAVIGCSNNVYLFAGTDAQWGELTRAGANAGRLEALNAEFGGTCIQVRTRDDGVDPGALWYDGMRRWEEATGIDCGAME